MSLFYLLSFAAPHCCAAQEKDVASDKATVRVEEELLYPSLVNKFYLLTDNRLFWANEQNNKAALQNQLINSIDSAFYFKLVQQPYHHEALISYKSAVGGDSVLFRKADRLFTDAAIAICKDLYQGYKSEPWVGYDKLSADDEDSTNKWLLKNLVLADNADKLQSLIGSLEPAGLDYLILKGELKKQLAKNSNDTIAMLSQSLNLWRWIKHFHFEKVAVINLPEARLRYYEKDSLLLNMKVVVGKTSTPTPRFATICDQVILYPYWYVPRSITFNEYLPKIKKDPSWIDANNMQVVDGTGRIMDHKKMNWNNYHRGYFPYTLRQSTGCDNALGVIKFNIQTPYGVYLHDTNNKTAFLSGLRYYSHGCIRLEEPFELGNRILEGKLNKQFLASCYKEQKPQFIQLKKNLPVFSVYMQAIVDERGRVHYFKDIYKLANL